MIKTRGRIQIRSNPQLALILALKSLKHHRIIALATIFGIAIGMCIVSTILIVDHNTAHTDIVKEKLTGNISIREYPADQKEQQTQLRRTITLPIKRIEFVKAEQHSVDIPSTFGSAIPSQRLSNPITEVDPVTPKGEEDYQTMRLAIRMASMLGFFIGAIIVFYTMRFSVLSRQREFSLLRCLGEHPHNIALSLMFESIFLGFLGTLTGLIAAYPAARGLLSLGISTTGRSPATTFSLPVGELNLMAGISISIALLGIITPVKSLYRMQISQSLQPRFAADGLNKNDFRLNGFSWLIPPLLLTSYLTMRPFLESWLSVVYFFMFEATFLVLLMLATLWWTRPFLRLSIRLIELTLRPFMPLETLLTVRRIRLTSHKFVFSIIGVILVFSLLNGLHAITRALKDEIYQWSSEAIVPYFFFKRNYRSLLSDTELKQIENHHGVYFFRLSQKVEGSLPIRLIDSGDFNRYRIAEGKPLFGPGQVILSKTLAARFGTNVGDYLRLDTTSKQYHFKIVDISDTVGTFAEDGQYVDIKSYALFSDGNPLFRNNLELTLGEYGVLRSANKKRPYLRMWQRDILYPFYNFKKSGRDLKNWQMIEIDKDFLIFDFILLMTIILACIGIVNTLLIQVHSRGRELSVLKTNGVSRFQTMRLLLVEGLVIGIVGAALSVLLGIALGKVSVAFLDHFTLFRYEYIWSAKATAAIFLFAVFTCCLSAIYPAFVATRISTTESLHYE